MFDGSPRPSQSVSRAAFVGSVVAKIAKNLRGLERPSSTYTP